MTGNASRRAALIAPEFDSYRIELPAAHFADLPVARLRDEVPQCTAEAAARARETRELQVDLDELRRRRLVRRAFAHGLLNGYTL